ncbi:MAG: hypothetical protein ACI4JC_01215 [Faecalibacterium sp.]
MEKEFNWRTHVIAIDFDGCLCEDNYPEVGTPNWEVINEAKRIQNSGACLILWTCRAGKDLEAAVGACREWGLEFDAINENPQFMIDLYGNDCRKIGADEYWDDRSVWMGTPGAFRNIRGISCRYIKRDEMRRFINHALRPEIEAIQNKNLPPDGHMDSYLHGISILLRECMERLERLMAIIDEQSNPKEGTVSGAYFWPIAITEKGEKLFTSNSLFTMEKALEQFSIWEDHYGYKIKKAWIERTDGKRYEAHRTWIEKVVI